MNAQVLGGERPDWWRGWHLRWPLTRPGESRGLTSVCFITWGLMVLFCSHSPLTTWSRLSELETVLCIYCTHFVCLYLLTVNFENIALSMIANFSNNKVLLFVLRRTMNKLVATLCLMGVLAGSIQGKSSKKGLCIPPGTNFHCGDLAAFDNVRYLFSICDDDFL